MTDAVLDVINRHRSIRQFTGQKLTKKQIQVLVAAAQHSSTSMFNQQYSIISVTDDDLKAQFAEITYGKWLMNCGHYFVMVADQHRNLKIAKEAGKSGLVLRKIDKFLASVFDSAIATENIVLAAESMGLGATIQGSVLNNPQRVVEMLQLPDLTFPVLGIAVGYPKDNPDLKPRMPQSLMHFSNGYNQPKDADKILQTYNLQIADYYKKRGSNDREETFSHHIETGITDFMDIRADRVQTALRAQGFLI